MMLNMEDIIVIIIQASGLGSLIALIIIYLKDKQWKRTEAAYQFYNDFDANKDCQLAMFMLDYGIEDAPFKFEYYFPKLSEKIIVHYNYDKLNEAMRKPYENLTEEEQVIRFLFDVYIGYLERIFYCLVTNYFKKKELIFYKYWLDKLISEEYKEIRNYAVENSCGLFVPFLEKYRKRLKKKVEKWVNKKFK